MSPSLRPSWDEYFLLQARVVALRSTCLKRRVGAVVVKDRRVVSAGYVGQPSGMQHCTERGFCLKDEKGYAGFCLSIHAEANAILDAARRGVPLSGTTLYCTLEPCPDCLKMAVQAGVERVVFETPYTTSQRNPRELVEFWERLLPIKVEQVVLPEPLREFAGSFLKQKKFSEKKR